MFPVCVASGDVCGFFAQLSSILLASAPHIITAGLGFAIRSFEYDDYRGITDNGSVLAERKRTATAVISDQSAFEVSALSFI